MNIPRTKVKGGIYGVAVGDALGATVEFMSQPEIIQKYGRHTEMIGGGWLNLAAGEFTDDTDMTISVAEGILANREMPIEEIGHRFIDWYHTNPKDIGNIIRRACANYIIYNSWDVAARKTREELAGKTAGNGCLMRTLPVTFAYYEDQTKMDFFSARIAAMTHQDSEAIMACVFYNRYVAKLITGGNKYDCFEELLKEVEGLPIIRETPLLHAKLVKVPKLPDSEFKASGYVVDTLITALALFLRFDSFEKTIIAAVNLGDDADTIGAVLGGLAGTFYGFEAIPGRWVNTLKSKGKLDYIIENL